MSGPLSSAVQKKLMLKLSSTRLRTNDRWEYAVSKSWLNSWQKAQVPESLDVQTTAFYPVTMSDIDSENSYIPETQWRMFVMWFGVDNWYQFRRRPVIASYLPIGDPTVVSIPYVLCDKELDFIQIWYGTLEEFVNNEPQKLLKVFAWDDFNYIGFQVRRLIGIPNNKNVRLWLNVKDDDVDIVLEPLAENTQSLISKLIDVVPDLQKLLLRRQTQIPRAYMNQKQHKEADIRKPLDEDWNCMNKTLSVSVLVEEVGLSVSGRQNPSDMLSCFVERFESIMTISSIRNQWDDVLSTCLESFTEETSVRSQKVKEELLSSARGIVGEKLDQIQDIRGDLESRLRSVEQREASVKQREDKVTEQERGLAEKLTTYKNALSDFQRKQQKLEEEWKRIEAQNKISETMVTLNVGGNVTTTSLTTLTSVEDSLLCQMFSGRNLLHRQQDGTYFIDRDGTNFRHVLNYLRDGPTSVNSVPETISVIQELIVEGEFYKLPKFVDALKEKLTHLQQRMDSMSLSSYESSQ